MFLTDYIEKIKLENQIKRQNEVILVYQMGKVGSTSIYETLKRNGILSYHIHDFNILRRILRQSSVTYKYITLLEKVLFTLRDICIFLPRKMFLKRLKKKSKIKIITLVREPIGRNISGLFQVRITRIKKLILSRDIKLIEKKFYEDFPHFYPLVWFDDELKSIFGIDIYKYNFDKEKGYQIIKRENIEVLVLKLEKLEVNKKIVSSFLSHKIDLVGANKSEDKWYSDIYKEFRGNFTPNLKYIDTLYNSKYMKHFYSEEEIEEFRNGWLMGR